MNIKNFMSGKVKKMLGAKVPCVKVGKLKPNLKRDLYGKNMVHFGYYEAEIEDGEEYPLYAESRRKATRLADKAVPGKKVKGIKDLTYRDAEQKYGIAGLMKIRSDSKMYKKQ